jgi:hypothetical protein
VDIMGGSKCRRFEVGVVAEGVHGVGEKEIFGLVEEFWDR